MAEPVLVVVSLNAMGESAVLMMAEANKAEDLSPSPESQFAQASLLLLISTRTNIQ